MGSKLISSHEAMKPCASHVHMAAPEAADPSCSMYSNLHLPGSVAASELHPNIQISSRPQAL